MEDLWVSFFPSSFHASPAFSCLPPSPLQVFVHIISSASMFLLPSILSLPHHLLFFEPEAPLPQRLRYVWEINSMCLALRPLTQAGEGKAGSRALCITTKLLPRKVVMGLVGPPPCSSKHIHTHPHPKNKSPSCG